MRQKCETYMLTHRSVVPSCLRPRFLSLCLLDRDHDIDFYRKWLNIQVVLMVLISFYKAVRRWWKQSFTHLHWIWTQSFKPGHPPSPPPPPTLLPPPVIPICILTSYRRHSLFSWTRQCATGVPAICNIAVGSSPFKIVFFFFRGWCCSILKYCIY